MAPIIQNNAEIALPFESSPIENSIKREPNDQFSQASSSNLKSFDPVIAPSWKNSPPLPMLNLSQNDDLLSPSYTLFEAESPGSTQAQLKNWRLAMQVNNRFVEHTMRCMQQQHHRKLIPNKLMEFEASAFLDLVGRHSRGTGVFYPPNPSFTNNIPSQMKTGMMQKKGEVGVSPLGNP